MFNRAIGQASVTTHKPDEGAPLLESQQGHDANDGISATANDEEKALLMDIGVWGPRLSKAKEFVADNRRLEGRIQELMMV